MTRKVILVCLLMLIAAVPSIGQQSNTAAAKPRFGTWGGDLTAMDRSVKPGDSFWHFVNGSWDRRTEIPADRTQRGRVQCSWSKRRSARFARSSKTWRAIRVEAVAPAGRSAISMQAGWTRQALKPTARLR